MTMRERLARALAKSLNQQSIDDGSAWELDFEKRGIDYDWEEYLLAVDALLTELENPTEAMLEAYYTAQAIPIPVHRRGAHKIKALARFKAMIQAIREGK